MSWPSAVKELDYRELADLVNGLDLDEQWTSTDENIARLVDRDDYYLRSMYSQWTHDPDDKEAARERAERKRRGVKPPPEPLVAPVAVRPPKAATEMWHDYLERAKKHIPETTTEDGRKKVSIAQLRAMQAAQVSAE